MHHIQQLLCFQSTQFGSSLAHEKMLELVFDEKFKKHIIWSNKHPSMFIYCVPNTFNYEFLPFIVTSASLLIPSPTPFLA